MAVETDHRLSLARVALQLAIDDRAVDNPPGGWEQLELFYLAARADAEDSCGATGRA